MGFSLLVVTFFLIITPILAVVFKVYVDILEKKESSFLDTLLTAGFISFVVCATFLFFLFSWTFILILGITIVLAFFILTKKYNIPKLHSGFLIVLEIITAVIVCIIYITLFYPRVNYVYHPVPVEFCMYGELDYNKVGCLQDGLVALADGKFFNLSTVFSDFTRYNKYEVPADMLVVYMNIDGSKRVGKIVNSYRSDSGRPGYHVMYNILISNGSGNLSTSTIYAEQIIGVDY